MYKFIYSFEEFIFFHQSLFRAYFCFTDFRLASDTTLRPYELFAIIYFFKKKKKKNSTIKVYSYPWHLIIKRKS